MMTGAAPQVLLLPAAADDGQQSNDPWAASEDDVEAHIISMYVHLYVYYIYILYYIY